MSPEQTGGVLNVGRSGAYEAVKSGLWPSIQVTARRRRVPTAWVYAQIGLPIPPPPGSVDDQADAS